MRTTTKRTLLEMLNKTQAEQSQACNKSCRYAVYTIIGTVWGILIKEDANPEDKIILFAVLSVSVMFFCIEAWRLCSSARKACKLHEGLCKGIYDELDVQVQMNIKSDWVYKVFYVQLLLCGAMILLLMWYVINRIS